MAVAGTSQEPRAGALGTFAGVFTPSILTILGIILFLRMGWVVGSAGVLRALLIVLAANAISVLTTMSLSAISTNLRVRGGGVYYLISRTLGVAYGGALGLVLFLAQSVSIAFYAIGFGEGVSAMVGGPEWLPRALAVIAVAVLFVLAWLGSDWATLFQYVVMAVLFLALIAFLIGGLGAWSPVTFHDNFRPASDLGFWTLFAIFFPAVTGFTQGVSMSGDLKDPGKSLPLGTFAAVGLSFLIYLAMTIVFAGASQGSTLVENYGAMRSLSAVPWLVDAGVIAATLSSALASFLGAPRILQSLSRDRVFPFLKPFAVGAGLEDNPRRGVLLTAVLAFATIGLGDLNLIAPVVSMFFLISYGLLNYATWVEASARSPYFRPRFRYFNRNLSLLGGVGCLGAMLAIHPVAGVVATVLVFAVHQYVARTVRIERWADVSRSRVMQRVRKDLLSISSDRGHGRDWRPVIVVLCEDETRRIRLLHFAHWIEGGSGFTTVVKMLTADGPRARVKRLETERALQAEIDREKLSAFVRAVVGPDPQLLFPAVLQAHGLGRVTANTVLTHRLDPSKTDPVRLAVRAQTLRESLRQFCNLILLEADEADMQRIVATPADKRVIDIWYRDNATGRLSIMLAYLMTRTSVWENATIRLILPTEPGEEEETRARAESELKEARIVADIETVTSTEAKEVIERSGRSSLVFLPFRLDADGPGPALKASLGDCSAALGAVALVLATEHLELDIQPEGGVHGEIAVAVDAAEEADKALKKSREALYAAAQATIQADGNLQRAVDSGASAEEIAELQKLATKATEAEGRARRRTLKLRAKARLARGEADTLTGEDTLSGLDDYVDENTKPGNGAKGGNGGKGGKAG